MKRQGIKYNGNKDHITQVVKSMPREAPDRKVTFHKGEVKVIGDDISDLAARELLIHYPQVFKETEIEVDDLTFAEETLKVIKEDLMNQGLTEEEVLRVAADVFGFVDKETQKELEMVGRNSTRNDSEKPEGIALNHEGDTPKPVQKKVLEGEGIGPEESLFPDGFEASEEKLNIDHPGEKLTQEPRLPSPKQKKIQRRKSK